MKDTINCIIMNGVSKSFGNKRVLSDINLQVPYGQIFGLLGPSGCGKSTTVKIIAGILQANSGETYILGEKMPQLSLMQKFGYMAQADALYTVLTAKENLKFIGMLYGMKGSLIKSRISEVLDLMKLTADIDKPVSEFSGGMKRRLSLAMAMLHNPPLLILDEPTVGIDPLLRKDIWEELRNMTRNGTTILITTHVMDEAIKCSKIAMMRSGRLIGNGTPDEIIQSSGTSSLEEAFIYYGKETGCDSDEN